MTLHVTLAEAGARLAELVARVREGEEVLIDDDGRTVARLGPAPAEIASLPQRAEKAEAGDHWRPGQPIDLIKHPRGMGVLAHLGPIQTDLLAPDEELLAAVEASRIFPDGDDAL